MNDATSPTLSLPNSPEPNPPEPGAPSGSPADRRLSSSRCLLLAGALVCSMVNPLAANVQEEGEDWATYYYLEPTPEQVSSRIKQFSSTGVFDKPDAIPPLVAFMAEVFRQNPAKLAEWSEELAQLPPQHRRYVWWALWNADIPEAHAALKVRAGTDAEDVQRITASKPIKWQSENPIHPSDLDVLWATFMASGNPAAVEKIIDVLAVPLPEQGQPGRIEALLLQGAARDRKSVV